MLLGDDVVRAGPGDAIVVPPGTPHAFAAASGQRADLLIVVTPGLERFEYFRLLDRHRSGEAKAGDLVAAAADRFDTHVITSSAWEKARCTTDV